VKKKLKEVTDSNGDKARRNKIPFAFRTREGVETLPLSDRLVDKPTMAFAASVCPRQIDTWVKEKRIPVVRLGVRCLRYHVPSVMEALRRFELKEVGR
jgi:hypothetical protein